MPFSPFRQRVARSVALALVLVALLSSVAYAAPNPSPCTASNLNASTSLQGATQSIVGPILFTNISAAACTVQGIPTVQLQDKNGATLDVTQINQTNPPVRLVTLQPGQQATVNIFWSNFCAANTHPGPYSAKATIPGDSALTAALNDVSNAPTPPPPCQSASEPSTLTVGSFHAATVVPHDNRYFPQTGFRIDNDTIWDYFNRRGGISTFGYPISRTFLFQGFQVQFFQRRIVEIGPTGNARLLNVLDPGLMPYTSFNFATFPAFDSALVATAPNPTDATAVLAWVKDHAPDSFNGMPVNFYQTFVNTVPFSVAFPNGGNPSLLTGIDLETWGIPTSQPMVDPHNHNFVYLRFQRGIMHYDATCNCTQGILLADYLKSILTGQNLPADLAQEAQNSPFYKQYDPTAPHWVHNASLLPNTDLTAAFTPE